MFGLATLLLEGSLSNAEVGAGIERVRDRETRLSRLFLTHSEQPNCWLAALVYGRYDDGNALPRRSDTLDFRSVAYNENLRFAFDRSDPRE
jgi:hypothetical protein